MVCKVQHQTGEASHCSSTDTAPLRVRIVLRVLRYRHGSSCINVHGWAAQNLTRLTVSQKCFPWISAISSSSGEGWREPSPAAKVPAPQGEPAEAVGVSVESLASQESHWVETNICARVSHIYASHPVAEYRARR